MRRVCETLSPRMEPGSIAPIREWDKRAFSSRQLAIIRAMGEALFDDGTNPEVTERLAWCVDDVDKFVGCAGGVVAFALRFLLGVIQWLPWPLGFGPTRMTSLSMERRVSYLQAIEHCTVPFVATSLFAWKSVLSMSYFEHPDALAETGYDGVCMTGEGSIVAGTRKPSRALRVLPAAREHAA